MAGRQEDTEYTEGLGLGASPYAKATEDTVGCRATQPLHEATAGGY